VELQVFSLGSDDQHDEFLGSVGVYLENDNTDCHSYQLLDDDGGECGTIVMSWFYAAAESDNIAEPPTLLNEPDYQSAKLN
jgi:hypothetical protein